VADVHFRFSGRAIAGGFKTRDIGVICSLASVGSADACDPRIGKAWSKAEQSMTVAQCTATEGNRYESLSAVKIFMLAVGAVSG